jgi:peptide deformylase
MKMDIIKHPDPRLYMVCNDVTEDEYAEALLIAGFMKDTLKSKIGAVGLAANQVAIMSRIIIVKLNMQYKIMINPTIIAQDNIATAREECLSLPRLSISIPRYSKITIEYLDDKLCKQELNLSGFSARLVLHEIDHLNGKTLLDYKTKRRSLLSIIKEFFS